MYVTLSQKKKKREAERKEGNIYTRNRGYLLAGLRVSTELILSVNVKHLENILHRAQKTYKASNLWDVRCRACVRSRIMTVLASRLKSGIRGGLAGKKHGIIIIITSFISGRDDFRTSLVRAFAVCGVRRPGNLEVVVSGGGRPYRYVSGSLSRSQRCSSRD